MSQAKTTKIQESIDYTGEDLDSMSGTPNYSDWVIGMFKEYVGSSLLEVGSGSGNFTKELLARFSDIDLTLLEPSQQYEKLVENKEITSKVKKVLKGVLSEYASQLKGVDTVLYNNVLEHVEDDQTELELVYDLLPQGGHVITFSPAMPFLMSDFDRSIGHYRRYTKKDIDAKFKKAGFKILKSHYVDLPGIIPWFVVFTLMKQNLSGGNAALYDSLVVPILKRLEPSQILPFGKNVLTIGVKE